MTLLPIRPNPLLESILALTDERRDFFLAQGGDASYRRGMQYYRAARMIDLKWMNGTARLKASVAGSRVYRTEFYFSSRDDLRMSCDCPLGGDEILPCKHLICSLLTIRELCGKPYEGDFNLSAGVRNQLGNRLLQFDSSESLRAHVPRAKPLAKSACLEIHLLGALHHAFLAEFYKAGKPLHYHSREIPRK